MKLNMEIAYVPVANVYQAKDMMDTWRTTSEKSAKLSYICSGLSLFTGLVFLIDKADSWWLHLLASVVFLAGGYLTKNWKYTGFVSVVAASLMTLCALALPAPANNWLFGCVFALCVMSLIPLFYSYKLVYNYNHVFKELEKHKGFPNFIVNTADLFADKMYIKDKKADKKTLFENKTEVSYNPFNTEEDYKNESFIRQQEFKQEKVPERLEKNITVTSVDGKSPLREEKTYKYGRSVFGRWLIFPHNTWREDEFEEKKDWMGYWRMNLDYPAARFPEFTMILILNGLLSAMIQGNIVISLLVILLTMIGTNQIKMEKRYGGFVTLGALLMGLYFNINLNNVGGTLACLFVYGCGIAINNGILFGSLRFLLNYSTYKELSEMEGFPTFIRTTADLYGDKMYIVDKPAPIVKKDPSQRVVKVMDIGYDEPKKKDDGAWNAFNYMDEGTDS